MSTSRGTCFQNFNRHIGSKDKSTRGFTFCLSNCREGSKAAKGASKGKPCIYSKMSAWWQGYQIDAWDQGIPRRLGRRRDWRWTDDWCDPRGMVQLEKSQRQTWPACGFLLISCTRISKQTDLWCATGADRMRVAPAGMPTRHLSCSGWLTPPRCSSRQ